MSCTEGFGLKPGGFWVHPYWDRENRAGFGGILIGMGEVGCVFGVFGCGNMKPDNFLGVPV